MAQRTVTVRFDGPGLVDGRVPFDQIVQVFGRFQDAVRHMVEDLVGHEPTRGPLPERIRAAGTLELVATKPGSLIAEVALAETGELLDFGEQALEQVVEGMDHPESLPPRVAIDVRDISRALTKTIDTVRFDRGPEKRPVTLRFDQPVAISPDALRPRGPSVAHGRLLEVDWKDHTAELHTPTGVVRLRFEEGLGPLLQRLATRAVSVAGEEAVTITGARRLTIDVISPSQDDQAFWQPTSAADLIREQGVVPFSFPAELSAPPPEEEDETVDEFLSAIFDNEAVGKGSTGR